MNYTGCRPLTDDEIDRILDGCQGRYRARDVALITLGIFTGYRVSEILSLKASDVWKDRDVVTEITVAKGFMKGKKKGRTMPLHTRVREAVFAHILASKLWHPLMKDRALFFSQGRGKSLSTRQALDIIKKAAERAGIDPERLGTHTLRKTFARRMWDSKAVARDPAKMARLLGHENWSNTLRYLEFADDLEDAVLA